MQTNLTTSNAAKTKIITEYDSKYCDLYIEYASQYVNPNGFWGEYNIDESAKETWMKQHAEFRQVVALVPNITTNIINKSIKQLLDAAAEVRDFKLLSQIVLKVLDMQFRVDKENGNIKDRKNIDSTAKNKGDLSINPSDEELARDLLAKNMGTEG